MADLNAPPKDIGPIGSGILVPSAFRPEKLPPLPPAADITIDAEDDGGVSVDKSTGALVIENDDGSVSIDLTGGSLIEDKEEPPTKFNDNLATKIGEMELGRISAEVMRGIQLDDQSRQQWLTDRAEGIRILGLRIENDRAPLDTSAAAMPGLSNVRHPLLLEAVLSFWANASGELLPAAGPVKVQDKLNENGESDELAEKLEEDLNYYLTTIASEYYPDFSRMLLNIGFGGIGMKKVFRCPLRQRPVSDPIDAVNLIVSNAATDLRNSGRFTHVSTMRPSVLKRMQIVGAYRDVAIPTPSGVTKNAVTEEVEEQQGVIDNTQQTEDREHTMYECYTELNIAGFEDKKNGKPTGLPLPYRVVIEKDSQTILEVRRNWNESDEMKTGKVPFVIYVFIPGFGFYGIGLLHILGNTANALTAGWREGLDGGMFANFPGFLYLKALGHQNTNEFRIPPGGGMGIDSPTDDINKAVMPLPYKEMSPGFIEFLKHIEETGARTGGSAQVQVAEGRQDAPVGTTLAMLEQAKVVEKATHKELWRSQNQELQLLKECFREDPESFLRAMKQKGGETDWDEESFKRAINDASLVPQADPNTPSHMHRLMKAIGLIQLDKQYPGAMDPTKVVKRAVSILGFGDWDSLKAEPQAGGGGVPPELMLEMAKLADKSQDRDFKMKFETFKQQNAVVNAQNEMQANMQKWDHERAIEAMQQQGNQLQHSVDLQQSGMELQAQRIETAGDIKVEELKEQTVDTAGQHQTAAEEAKQETEDTKGRHAVAAARAKPAPKPAAKKAPSK